MNDVNLIKAAKNFVTDAIVCCCAAQGTKASTATVDGVFTTPLSQCNYVYTRYLMLNWFYGTQHNNILHNDARYKV
jgi:hypothetical protein